ncbi:hypothetical protein QOZ95_005467 [Paenibacillus brasilensis]|uniref:Uncharacterized protein n=1 Tax=Paenibacillus brasilensis TaxID=128574 RepID=A0ABU0L7G9_9BACL|nr:hypothetical protein [Paenibacillus brasilensis]
MLISHKLLFRFEVKREMENQNTECPQPPDDLAWKKNIFELPERVPNRVPNNVLINVPNNVPS